MIFSMYEARERAIWFILKKVLFLLPGLARDVLSLAVSLGCLAPGLVVILLGIIRSSPGAELYWGDWENYPSLAYQVFFTVFSVLPVGGPPGRLLVLVLVGICMCFTRDIPIVTGEVSYTGDENLVNTVQAFFVNGVCVDYHWLKLKCTTLEAALGRRVQGILNQSYGLFLDLAECFLQRNLGFTTEPVARTYCVVLAALRTNNRRAMLIGHSQGGIIVQLVVLRIALFHPELIDHLDVITIASAASEFADPGLRSCVHYANQFDLVARLGVLGSRGIPTPQIADINPSASYGGHIRMAPRKFGHLLSTFYADFMGYPLG